MVLSLASRLHPNALRERLPLLPPLLARVELVEVVADNRDRETDHQNTENGAKTADDLADTGYRGDVAIPDLKYEKFKYHFL